MKRIRSTFRALLCPLDRARALRSDDRAQVMVLTGVMVFVIMIMSLSTLNTSKMIHNRIRAQNAVDAAADAYALWQARGMNLQQHINDFHLETLSVLYWIETPSCIARIGCGILSVSVWPPTVAVGQICCNILGPLISGIETAQDILTEVILIVQEVLNFAMPILGIFAANSIAHANGADPIVGALVGTIEDSVANFGGDLDIAAALAGVPLLDAIYVFPLLPDKAFTLNVERRDPPPDKMPWKLEENFVNACMPWALCPSSCPNTCGWEATFMYGYPSYNTWIAGKMGENILGGLEELSWLNPKAKSDPDVAIRFTGSDEFVFEDTGGSGFSRFKNQSVIVIASSQASGHSDESLQPVVETSKKSGFQFARPQLISVHLGDPASDDDMTNMFIWH